MARKRTKQESHPHINEDHPTPEGPVSNAAVIDAQQHGNDVDQAFRESGITTADQLPERNGEQHEQDEPQRRLVRGTFTSSAAGVHAVEDKRFNLPRVGIDFDNDARATDEEKAELKAAGFRYDPRDKGYTAIANRETRQARDELAPKFAERRLKAKAEQDEGQSR